MKSIKLQLLAVLLALFATTSCEKDDSNASPSPSGATLVGTYSFESEEDLIVRKWIENGVEVTPDSSEINYMVSASSFQKSGLNYEFTSNYKLTVHVLSNSEKFTTDYKIKNNVVYIPRIENPQSDEDYAPLFAISNDKIYSYHHAFEFRNSNGSDGISILEFDSSYNVLDTGLKQNNMQNVSQLQVGEEILISKSKLNFSKN